MHSRAYLQSKTESFTQIVAGFTKIGKFVNTLTNSIALKDTLFHSDIIYWRSLRESLMEAGTQFSSTRLSPEVGTGLKSAGISGEPLNPNNKTSPSSEETVFEDKVARAMGLKNTDNPVENIS